MHSLVRVSTLPPIHTHRVHAPGIERRCPRRGARGPWRCPVLRFERGFSPPSFSASSQRHTTSSPGRRLCLRTRGGGGSSSAARRPATAAVSPPPGPHLPPGPCSRGEGTCVRCRLRRGEQGFDLNIPGYIEGRVAGLVLHSEMFHRPVVRGNELTDDVRIPPVGGCDQSSR